jgi:hypothetical protein
MALLFVLLSTMLVVLVSSTSGDKHFRVIATHSPQTHQDWGRAKTAGSRFAYDNKELGHQFGGGGGSSENGSA